jgi:RNA polymerase sigma factor (sigma-70 family)
MRRHEYNQVVALHSDKLFGYAFRFLRSKADASDIVQDVFEKLWMNRKKIEFDKAKSWMFTCAHNAMINFMNKKQRLSLTGFNALPEKGNAQVPAFETKDIVNRAVSILPPVQKSVVLLRDLEGYSYDEIGSILGLSSSQVKVYLFRARNKMKKQLKNLVEIA